jgi:peptidoglycan/xylan/chitin deacetylase (PgdA/CDA1 family)
MRTSFGRLKRADEEVSMAEKIPLIWSNDDITVGFGDSMLRQLELLDRFGIKGSFFVIPCPEKGTQRLTDDPKLVDLLKQAMADGHECAQHSTTHVCEENGTADLRMFDLMGDNAKVDYSRNRFQLERLWQVDALEAQIGWGLDVWKEAFGAPSPGFRPGCGSFCGNMYVALENLGFKWVSSRLISMTGWMWQAGRASYPLRLEGPARPYWHGKLLEIPILDDVAFRVPEGEVDRYVELGWRLWEECRQAGVAFHLVSHFHGLERNGGTGYAVHEKLLPRILATGQAEPMTAGEYQQRVRRGEFPLADPQRHYPRADAYPEWHAFSRRGG